MYVGVACSDVQYINWNTFEHDWFFTFIQMILRIWFLVCSTPRAVYMWGILFYLFVTLQCLTLNVLTKKKTKKIDFQYIFHFRKMCS